jgi:hypothetical protein
MKCAGTAALPVALQAGAQIGHDTPVSRFAIDSTMTYVKRAKEIHAASADAKTYSENLKAAFPDLTSQSQPAPAPPATAPSTAR